MIDLFANKILGRFSYDNISYNLLEGRKKVLDGIGCGKIIISNYSTDYTNFSDVISRIKDKIYL